MGLGGGPIDSGYVLAQATHLLGLQIAPQLISDAQGHETDPAMRELLAVALAIARDPSQAPEVRRIAKEHRMGSIRALAIKGLRRLADTDSLQTLLHALRDRYTAIAGLEGVGTAPLRKVYPVRREAVLTLRAFGKTVPPDSVVDVPLSAPPSDTALYAHLLEDQDPQSCLAAVQLLATQGAAGRPYLQTFIAKNRNEPTLQQSVNLAQRSLVP